jgi:hypothetical protein
VTVPVEMNSSTACPTLVWNEVLPRIISAGVLELPMTPELLMPSSSIPP